MPLNDTITDELYFNAMMDNGKKLQARLFEVQFKEFYGEDGKRILENILAYAARRKGTHRRLIVTKHPT